MIFPNLFRFMFCPRFKASSVVSGSLSFVVSGNLKAKTAATIAILPKSTIVNGGHISANIACIETAITPPTLPVFSVQNQCFYFLDFFTPGQSNQSLFLNSIPVKLA